ncbi:methylated-DNA-(protein)-cysteine S-methyltransferase, partial [mine drainage metagenome]
VSSSTFDQKVWACLGEVPIGSTITYGELARRAGYPGSARAVGGSMHRNPLPIVIPCHRVVGQDGSVTGYGLGRWRKRWLLEREGAWPLRARSAEGPKGGPSQRTLDESAGRRRRSRPVRHGAAPAN